MTTLSIRLRITPSTRVLGTLVCLGGLTQPTNAHVVRIAPIVTSQPTPGADVRYPGAQPPPSQPQVETGETFFLEIWATNTSEPLEGLACVYVDVHYNPTTLVDAVDPAQSSPLFPIDPISAVIDDPAGYIATAGGCQTIPAIDMLGVDEWVMIKRIEMIAGSQNGTVSVAVADPDDVIAATTIIGELFPVAPADIDFQSRVFHVGDPPPPVPAASPSAILPLFVLILAAGAAALHRRHPPV